MKILYSSAQVRRAILHVLDPSAGRRVAIAAFVGQAAEAYLPDPRGLLLVCWPKAGGTDPGALRKLISRGASVAFVESLHMKVYWGEKKGAVVTSANLSSNALGPGGLKELGVQLPPGDLDIDRILTAIDAKGATSAQLLKLDKAHISYQKKYTRHSGSAQVMTFRQWLAAPFRPTWKLGWWDEDGALASTAKQLTQVRYARTEPHDFLSCRKSDYAEDEWVLTFSLKASRAQSINWLAADHIVPILRNDKRAYSREYPFQAIQVWPRNVYPPPPFRIDKRFRKAFSRAVRTFGKQNIMDLKKLKPPRKLLNLIAEAY